jgi:hypothetical protein
MPRVFLTVFALAALAGCGKESEKAFNDSFNKSFLSSCISSASQGGISHAIARQICDCAKSKIDEEYSPAKKIAVSKDQLDPIMNECVNSVVQTDG